MFVVRHIIWLVFFPSTSLRLPRIDLFIIVPTKFRKNDNINNHDDIILNINDNDTNTFYPNDNMILNNNNNNNDDDDDDNNNNNNNN